METKEIDMRGQICPSTLLTALKEINSNRTDLRSGNLKLAFLTDNRDATVTLPDAVVNMGYEATVNREAEYYRVEVYVKAR